MVVDFGNYFTTPVSHAHGSSSLRSAYIDKLSTYLLKILLGKGGDFEAIYDDYGRATYIENCSSLLDTQQLDRELRPLLGSFVRCPTEFNASTVELHVRWPGCPPIPPHQDNFYHQLLDHPSFKCLIPLSHCSKKSGFLHYFNIPHSYPILYHSASSIKGFSSYIMKSLPVKAGISTPQLQKGSPYFHSLNNIHFAHSNALDAPCFFLVVRFDHAHASTDERLRQAYLAVRQEHLSLVQSHNYV